MAVPYCCFTCTQWSLNLQKASWSSLSQISSSGPCTPNVHHQLRSPWGASLFPCWEFCLYLERSFQYNVFHCINLRCCKAHWGILVIPAVGCHNCKLRGTHSFSPSLEMKLKIPISISFKKRIWTLYSFSLKKSVFRKSFFRD